MFWRRIEERGDPAQSCIRLSLQTKLSIVELVFNFYWLWQIKLWSTLLHHSVISLVSVVLAGVRCANKELVHISLVFSYGSRTNSSKLRNRMSKRHQRNQMDQVDNTLHRISGPKKRRRRKYHNITRCCKNGLFLPSTELIVYYTIGWWKCVQSATCTVFCTGAVGSNLHSGQGVFFSLRCAFCCMIIEALRWADPRAKWCTVFKLES